MEGGEVVLHLARHAAQQRQRVSAKLRVDAVWKSWRICPGTPGLAYDMPTPDFSADIMVGRRLCDLLSVCAETAELAS